MELLLAGLAGVALGAGIAIAVFAYVLRRRADRDILERRLRAFAEYVDCLGGLDRALDGADSRPELIEQAWRSVLDFCREVRLTSWLFSEDVRARLGAITDTLQKEERAYRSNGAASPARAAQVLSETYREAERLLRREIERAERAFRRYRLLPEEPPSGGS